MENFFVKTDLLKIIQCVKIPSWDYKRGALYLVLNALKF